MGDPFTQLLLPWKGCSLEGAGGQQGGNRRERCYPSVQIDGRRRKIGKGGEGKGKKSRKDRRDYV